MPFGTNSALHSLIHPRLHASLPQAYRAWVTVEKSTESQGDDYAIEDAWTAVPHLAALRGVLAPASATEARTAALTNVTITHVLDLQSYHPEITVGWRVRVARVMGESGTVFNITGVKFDSQAMSSRLELEEVSH